MAVVASRGARKKMKGVGEGGGGSDVSLPFSANIKEEKGDIVLNLVCVFVKTLLRFSNHKNFNGAVLDARL